MSTASKQRVVLISGYLGIRLTLMMPTTKAFRLKDLLSEDPYPTKLSRLIGDDQDRITEGRKPQLFSVSQIRRIDAAIWDCYDYFTRAELLQNADEN